MEKIIKQMKDFFNKKYCMITLAICIILSTLIAFVEGIMKLFSVDISGVNLFIIPTTLDEILKYARTILIYFSVNSLVGLLIDLRYRLKTVEERTPKSFVNMNEATTSIKEAIKKAAYKNRTEELVIKVYGMRHRQNMTIIKQALNEIRGNIKSTHRKIKLCLYYSDPNFLESLKLFNGDSSFTKMINEQKEKTESSMDVSMNEIDNTRYNFVELKIKKHFDTPLFWAILIDNNDIFWGYFTRAIDMNNNIEYIQGTPNKCFHFDNGVLELDGFSDWIFNIFERLDKWSKDVI